MGMTVLKATTNYKGKLLTLTMIVHSFLHEIRCPKQPGILYYQNVKGSFQLRLDGY